MPHKSGTGKRRSDIEIAIDVLQSIEDKPDMQVTQVAWEAGTNHRYARKFTDHLVKAGFVNESDDERPTFTITERGQKWKASARRMIELLWGR